MATTAKKTKKLTKKKARELTITREAITAAAKAVDAQLGDQAVELEPGSHHVQLSCSIDATLNQGEPTTRIKNKLTDGQTLELIADAVGPEMFGELLDRANTRRKHWFKGATPKRAWSERRSVIRQQINGWIKSSRLTSRVPVAARTDRIAEMTIDGSIETKHTKPEASA